MLDDSDMSLKQILPPRRTGAAGMKRLQEKKTFAMFLLKVVNAQKTNEAFRAFTSGMSPWKNVWQFLRYLPMDVNSMVCAKRFKCLAHLIRESLLDGPVRGWKQRKDEKFSEMVKNYQNRQRKVKNQKVKMKNQDFDLYGGFDDGEDQRDYDSGSSSYDSGDWSYSGWHGSGGGGYGYNNDGDNTDDYNSSLWLAVVAMVTITMTMLKRRKVTTSRVPLGMAVTRKVTTT